MDGWKEFIQSNGAWGVVGLCVFIIGVLVWSIIKITSNFKKSEKDEQKFQISIDNLHGKIDNLKTTVDDLSETISDVEKRMIETTAESRQVIIGVVKNIEDIAVKVTELPLV